MTRRLDAGSRGLALILGVFGWRYGDHAWLGDLLK